jgi:ribose/xylose/arabinose/galactoside ABC-type transport system permease subunit
MARSSSPGWHRVTDSRLFFPFVVLGLILLFDLVFDPAFFQLEIIDGHLYGSLVDIFRNGSAIMLLAIGMTVVIAVGGVDLSVGAVMAISSSVAAILVNPDFLSLTRDPTYTFLPLPIIFVVSLFAATLCGLWNGILVAYGGIQPMVATLILMIAGRGIAQLMSSGTRIQIFYEPYGYLGNGWIIVPVSLLVVAVVYVFAWVMTRRTALGMFIESVGINARSSYYSGINEKLVKLIAYMFCGFCAGVAGLVASSNIRTSDANNIGLNFELDAILAVVIGGTALGAGGRFSLLASIVGALVIQAITTSMYAVGVPANALLAIKGVVVIIVILVLSAQVKDVVGRLFNPKRATS